MVSVISILVFYILIDLFKDFLVYESELKLLTIIVLVIITVLIYILISLLTKTFKYADIKLKY